MLPAVQLQLEVAAGLRTTACYCSLFEILLEAPTGLLIHLVGCLVRNLVRYFVGQLVRYLIRQLV